MSDQAARDLAAGRALRPAGGQRRIAPAIQAGALRALRPLAPAFTAAASQAAPASPVAGWLLMIAVGCHLTISSNLLYFIGIDYEAAGGLPLVKFHPATYLTFAAILVHCWRSDSPLETLAAMLGRQKVLAWSICGFGTCIVYYSSSLGLSGGAALVESYLSAVVLALGCEQCSDGQLRRLGWMMLGLFVLSQPIAIAEPLFHWHLVPLYGGDTLIAENAVDWRGKGLFDHPLTGAMMMEMAAMLLLALPMAATIRICLLVLLLVSMIAFGGRTALACTLIVVFGYAGHLVMTGLLRRSIKPGMLALVVVGLVAAPLLLFVAATDTGLGSRLTAHSYADDSAAARLDAWGIPAIETSKEFLFGTTAAEQASLIYGVGLKMPLNDIENFWLLTFVNIGLFGFIIYLSAFLPFVGYLWWRATSFGRLALVTTLVVASTSSSLGRKSNVLFILVAVIFAMRGFGRRAGDVAAPEPSAREAMAAPSDRGLRARDGAGT